MKKIGLFLEAESPIGGIYQYNLAVLDAVAALPADEYSTVIAYSSDFWGERLQSYKINTLLIPRGIGGRIIGHGLRLLGLPVTVLRQLFPYFHPMARTLLREQCDLWIFPAHDGWSYEIPVPALGCIHDLMHRYERQFPEVSANGEYRRREFVFRNICTWTKGVLVDSEVGKEHVIESYGLEERRIHVLPFIAPKYVYSFERPKNFDARYDLPQKFIFYPAQFWEHKNHRGLIRAIGQLKGMLPDLKLVLAGSRKNAYESVLQLVKELNLQNDVIFLGYVPDEDITEIYLRARALIMPTFFGPTNIPPLEAFVIGCPVAVSDIYGMREQVSDAALLFNPKSVGEIADCIRRLWTDDDLCSELVAKGKQRDARWRTEQFNERLRTIIEKIV